MLTMNQHLFEGIMGSIMIFGLFGNLNVIVAIARKKVLRTKGAMLVFILAIAHLICNLSELRVLILRFRYQTNLTGRQCFQFNLVYSFAIMFQSALFLSMSLDLCFCILIPIKHMLWPKTKYICLMCIMPICFAICLFTLNFISITDEVAPYCLFMLTMDDGVFEVTSTAIVSCNLLTLIITVVSVLIAVKKSQDMKSHRHSQNSRRASAVEERRKVFRSTFYMMAIYIVSWLMSSLLFRALVEVYEDEKQIIEFMPYLAIITMFNFCQAYFVTFFRSPRFRKAYREHFHWLSCGCLYKDIFEQPDLRGGESGSRQDSNTNQPVIRTIEKSEKDEWRSKDHVKKTVRILEDEVI